MSFDSLNLNKQIVNAMEESGFVTIKSVQEKCVKRFAGGQDWVVVGPEGCGKTTTYILSILMKLKYAVDEAPRALVLVKDRDKVVETVEMFETLGCNTDLRVIGLVPGNGMQAQRDDLFTGVDIVVGTPDRVSTIYLNCGLNVNKIQTFVIDDAEYIVKQGFQGLVHRLKDGLPKCQRLAFTEVYHEKLDRLLGAVLNSQGTIEIKAEVERKLELVPQEVYPVLNYKTKLNLINLLLDREQFGKLIVFCNGRLTAGQLYTSVEKRLAGKCAMLKPLFYNQRGVADIETFYETDKLNILFVANEDSNVIDCTEFPNVLHFDVPESLDLMVARFELEEDSIPDQRFMIFATDIEQILIKKLENKVGSTFLEGDIPLGLIVEGNRKRKVREEKEIDTGAFHEKKASNSKTVNMGIKDKMKIHGKARKGSSRFK